MHCETLKIALATKYILFYAFITEGLQYATIWNTLHKVGNLYQSSTTLGLEPVSIIHYTRPGSSINQPTPNLLAL